MWPVSKPVVIRALSKGTMFRWFSSMASGTNVSTPGVEFFCFFLLNWIWDPHRWTTDFHIAHSQFGCFLLTYNTICALFVTKQLIKKLPSSRHLWPFINIHQYTCGFQWTCPRHMFLGNLKDTMETYPKVKPINSKHRTPDHRTALAQGHERHLWTVAILCE